PEKLGCIGLACQLSDVCGGEQCGNLCGQRKGGISRVLLPSILLRYRTVTYEIAGGLADHGPPALHCFHLPGGVTPQQVEQQDRKSSLIHLDAMPIGLAIQPKVLCPVTFCFLCRLQIPEHAQCINDCPCGDKSAGDLDQVAWPHQVVPTQIVIPLIKTPGDGKAGDGGT